LNGLPSGFWGKLSTSVGSNAQEWHPLADHCADVAACVEALLGRTLLRKRLAGLASLSDLSDQQTQRLSVLAAIHDIGKFAVGFYNKAYGRKPQCGHVAEALGLFGDPRFSRRTTEALLFSQMSGWAEDFDGLFIATIAHHGRPVPLGKQLEPGWWEPSAGLDPFAGIASLIEKTRTWFPIAWMAGGDRVPSSPRFQHAWSGLLTLADWIGSDSDRFFPFTEIGEGEHMTLSRERARSALAHLGLDVDIDRSAMGPDPPGFEQVAPIHGMSPWPAQTALMDTDPGAAGSVVVLEAETGSGKTEAALAYFARLFHSSEVDGMYFALPTRTAATQIHRRVCGAVDRLFSSSSAPPVILAVPGYLRVDDSSGTLLSPFQALWNDDERERLRYRSWAAERPKRYLAGAIAVGTIDQVLLSALAVPHADLRSASLLRQLLVIDEVHASDAYMNRLVEEVLDHHLAANGHALLMSATLGSSTRTRLLSIPRRQAFADPPSLEAAIDTPYPLISLHRNGADCQHTPIQASRRARTVFIEIAAEMSSASWIAQRALAAAQTGARVLVVRNTVTACLDVQDALENEAKAAGCEGLLFSCAMVHAPHHARYAVPDRELLDQAIEGSYGKERPSGGLVVASTQTIEQSLDIDGDFLITDLCPMDVLLQRIGRLHRHDRARVSAYEIARVVVLIPEKSMTEYLRTNGEARGPYGLGTVYEDLRVLEATLRMLQHTSQISIPADNRRLVESATHPAALDALVRSLSEPWVRHQHWILGELLGQGRLASLNIIHRELPFGDPAGLFPSGELSRRIQTRLGEGDRIVRIIPPQSSPFSADTKIKELTIPFYLVGRDSRNDEDRADDLSTEAGGFAFRFGSRHYTYNRLGLRPKILNEDNLYA